MQFTLGMYGEGDFFSMKGVVEEFFEKIQMQEKHICILGARQISFTMEK